MIDSPQPGNPGCEGAVVPELNSLEIFALEKSFDTHYNAPGGSAPAAMAFPGCDCAVVPVHDRGEISRSGNAGASQCAPRPPWGQG